MAESFKGINYGRCTDPFCELYGRQADLQLADGLFDRLSAGLKSRLRAMMSSFDGKQKSASIASETPPFNFMLAFRPYSSFCVTSTLVLFGPPQLTSGSLRDNQPI
jgi:hypothetical protein